MPRALSGLRVRLVVAFTLVAVVAAVTTGALTFREARNGVLQQSQDTVIEDFRHRVNTLAPNYRFPPDASDLQSFATDVSRGGPSQNWRVLVAYREARATSEPGDEFRELSPRMRESVRTRLATVFQRVTRNGHSSLVVGMPVTFAGRYTTEQPASGLEVYLTVPQREEQGYVDALVTAIERATVPALALAVLVALLAARGVLRPVRALRRATRSIAEGRLDTRLAVQGSDELADLSRTFNETAAALEGRWRNCGAWRPAPAGSPRTSPTNCAPRWRRCRRSPTYWTRTRRTSTRTPRRPCASSARRPRSWPASWTT